MSHGPAPRDLRFALARRGHQAHLIGLAIALAAAEARHTLLTRGRDVDVIAPLVGLDRDRF